MLQTFAAYFDMSCGFNKITNLMKKQLNHSKSGLRPALHVIHRGYRSKQATNSEREAFNQKIARASGCALARHSLRGIPVLKSVLIGRTIAKQFDHTIEKSRDKQI